MWRWGVFIVGTTSRGRVCVGVREVNAADWPFTPRYMANQTNRSQYPLIFMPLSQSWVTVHRSFFLLLYWCERQGKYWVSERVKKGIHRLAEGHFGRTDVWGYGENQIHTSLWLNCNTAKGAEDCELHSEPPGGSMVKEGSASLHYLAWKLVNIAQNVAQRYSCPHMTYFHIPLQSSVL